MSLGCAFGVSFTTGALASAAACFGDDAATSSVGPPAADASLPPVDGAVDGGAPEIDAGPVGPCNHEKPFASPVVVPLGTQAQIISPTLTDDERQIVFSTLESVDSGPSAFRLAYATRSDRAAAFGAPTRPTLLDAINPPTRMTTGAPHPTRSGSALYFVASTDIAASALHIRRAMASNGFNTKAPIVELDTLLGENGPVPTADDTGIYYAKRTGAGTEVWFARRAAATGPYTSIQSVPELNSSLTDLPGWLTPDGCRLYFTSNRSGSLAIYFADKPVR